MINATKKARTEDTVIPRQEPLQLQKKVMWAPHNERNVLMSVDWKG